MTVDDAWADLAAHLDWNKYDLEEDPDFYTEWLAYQEAVKQAILDEGLKEERARVDGLVEAAAYYIDRLEGVLARRVVRDLDESRAGWEVALAAVRALRAVSPTPVEEGG